MAHYKVITSEPGKKIVLVDQDGETKRYSVAQVKSYLRPSYGSVNFIGQIVHTFRKCGLCTPTFLTEVVESTDPRARSPEMREAIDTEISDLLKRGAIRVTKIADLPADANLLPASFVLAIKSSADGRIRYKARYVIGRPP